MTCVLSPWQPFSLSYEWSSMNPEGTGALPIDSYEYAEPGGSHSSNGGTKKRASRAGTRSVSTLSAAQLDRKRANDREAQRAIRQRTRDHIESLERTINELQATQEASEKLLTTTQQRNHDLETENAYLRSRLEQAGIVVNVPSVADEHPSNLVKPIGQPDRSITRASMPNAGSADPAPNAPSSLSLRTSELGHARNEYWQQPQNEPTQVQSAPPNLVGENPAYIGSNLSGWRSHDGSQSIHPPGSHVMHQSHSHQAYAPVPTNVYPQWTAPPAQVYQGQSPETKRAPSPQHDHQQRAQSIPTVQTPQQVAQRPMYPPPVPVTAQVPESRPRPDFQPTHYPPAAPYQAQHEPQQAYMPQAQYQMNPPSAPPAAPNEQYALQPAQMPPHLPVATAYEPGHSEQQYHEPSHQSVPYQRDPGEHPYTLAHYPAG